MKRNIEKILHRLGPELSEKFGPAIIVLLMARPWLIPVILLGSVSIGALLEMVKEDESGTSKGDAQVF